MNVYSEIKAGSDGWMDISKVCTAVQHTNAIRMTSFPDLAACSPPRGQCSAVLQTHEGHPTAGTCPTASPGAPAKTPRDTACLSTSAVGLYSSLEQRGEAPEMPEHH